MNARGWVVVAGVILVLTGFFVTRVMRPAAKKPSERTSSSSRSPKPPFDPDVSGGHEHSPDRSPSHSGSSQRPVAANPGRGDDGVARRSVEDLLKELRELHQSAENNFGSDAAPKVAELIDRLADREEEALAPLRDRIYDGAENLEFRESLVRTLGAMKGEAAARALMEVLQAQVMPQPLRSQSLTALRHHLTTPERRGWVFDSTRSVFETDPKFEGRYNLVVMMGQTGDSRAVPVLIQAMGSANALDVRTHAASALANFGGSPEARAALQRTVESDPDPQMRRNAIVSLSGDASPEIRALWEQSMERETDPANRGLIRRALKEKFGIER